MEQILSAGIDIGTSTTQLIFSRLTVKNVGGFGDVPRIEIVDKEIIYRSEIHFTPLLSEREIDAVAVKDIIISEYKKAGITPSQLTTGAVIITGESSRKRNAKEVVQALSEIAGDFVVATAGPDLESVLAGKGSGAAALSEATGKLVANLDIGGGTTNICYFHHGRVLGTACLDIGGRLIKINEGRITYISDKIKLLLDEANISLKTGDLVDTRDKTVLHKLDELIDIMVKLLEQALHLSPPTKLLELMKTNRLITCDKVPEIVTFSGGVADCIRSNEKDRFRYGDIGVLLGEKIRSSVLLQERGTQQAIETVNATVIGAGNYSMEVSGSTIEYSNCNFPMKNLPVVEVDINSKKLDMLGAEIISAIERMKDEDTDRIQLALAAKGIKYPSYSQIEQMASEIVMGMESEIGTGNALILILEEDIGKALGQALKRHLPQGMALLCIDHISCHQGDYIDIGAPIASGKVVPVIVKTLVFNS